MSRLLTAGIGTVQASSATQQPESGLWGEADVGCRATTARSDQAHNPHYGDCISLPWTSPSIPGAQPFHPCPASHGPHPLPLFFPCYFRGTSATFTVAPRTLLRAATRRAPERRSSLRPIIRLRVRAVPRARARVLVETSPSTRRAQALSSLLLESGRTAAGID